jgi:hypothetical protein
MSSHYSYGYLLRQRVVVAGLTLGLVTIMTGLFIELTLTSKKTTIDNSVQRLIEPLNPLLDLKTVEKLEAYPLVTKEAIRSAIVPRDVNGVGEIVPNETSEAGATPAPVVAVPSPSPEPPPEPVVEELPPDENANPDTIL